MTETLPGARSIDMESLLWDIKDILRGLAQVSRAQSEEIERLGGRPWDGARELQERADGAVASCDLALAEWTDDANSSLGGRVDVAAWLEATRQLAADAVDAADHTGDLSFVSASSGFWRPDQFNWADEPASEEEEEEEEDIGSEENGIILRNLERSVLQDFESSLPVPELDSHLDSASDSDGSFFDEGCHILVESATETTCATDDGCQCDIRYNSSTEEEPVLKAVRRYSFSDAGIPGAHSQGVTVDKKAIDIDQKVDAQENEHVGYLPFSMPRLPKAAARLRKLARIESLPNLLALRQVH